MGFSVTLIERLVVRLMQNLVQYMGARVDVCTEPESFATLPSQPYLIRDLVVRLVLDIINSHHDILNLAFVK